VNDWTVLRGDSREVVAALEAGSVDAVVTDPPYELGFMGKGWDKSGIAFDAAFWANVLRALKPGAYLLACGGTRTYHRMAAAIEDAGFEIRDCLAWLYGSGFPKSLNLGDGLGTALKPAYEPIVLARKPFKGTVKANVATHGTGALNIDACRILFASEDDKAAAAAAAQRAGHDQNIGRTCYGNFDNGPASIPAYMDGLDKGRWPANVAIDELAALVLDEQSGITESNPNPNPNPNPNYKNAVYGRGMGGVISADNQHADIGGASRFYYVAKPSREERDYGCERMPLVSPLAVTGRTEGSAGSKHGRAGMTGRARGNFHPTVKPVELMRWLVRLVTPIGGTVFDPFTGSGTTGMACRYEQRGFIGIEREPEYWQIANARIAAVAPLFGVAGAGDAVDPQLSARGTDERPRATGLLDLGSSDVA
jgi:hypothetical protein